VKRTVVVSGGRGAGMICGQYVNSQRAARG
jgi:hypothetical protein